MTRSCARFLALAALVPLAATVLIPGPVVGQDAPVVLAPPQPLSAPAGPAAPAAAPAESAAPSPGIQVDTLGEIDANSVGVLDAARGGFGIAMWRGTSRELVERLLPQLPAAPRSDTARELMHRLLLSAAETPAGPSAGKGPSLVAIRVDRLLAQGDVVAAQRLLRAVPSRVEEEAIQRARAEVAFLLNDNAGACSLVSARLGTSPSTFWRKAHVFCQLLSGDAGAAQIGTGLLQEQGVDDPAFYALVRVLAGDRGVAVGGLDKPHPLHIAMMRAGRVQVPASVVTDGTAAVLRAVALGPNADLDTRLDAAERAEARGALETELLRQLYLSVNFTPDELSNALSVAEKLPGPRGRALLYRTARGQNVASAQAEIIARAFRLARPDQRLRTAIRVFQSQLAAMEASGDLAWFAADAGAALYVLRAYEAAEKWTALARENPEATVRAAGDGTPPPPADVVLWPLSVVAGLPRPAAMSEGIKTAEATAAEGGAVGGGPLAPVVVQRLAAPDAGADGFDEKAFRRWWLAMEGLGTDARAARATVILAAMEALGARVDTDAWAGLVTASATQAVLPAPGLMAGLRHAAAGERLGETVLLALAAIGKTEPGALDARVLAPVLRALRAVGLHDAARALAVEAVFGVTR